MQYSRLNKFFLINKVLRNYNRSQSFRITQKRLATILLIHYYSIENAKNPSFKKIHLELERLGRTERWQNLKRTLEELLSADLIEKEGALYKISYSSIDMLSDLEKRLKNQRY